MNKKIHTKNSAKFLIKAILSAFILLPFLGSAQTLQQPAYNSKGQQMEMKEGNYTSFTSAARNTTSWTKFNSQSDIKHPEFGAMPFNAEYPGFVEVLAKRTIDERYFVDEKNPTKFYMQKALGDLHHKINGNWVTIDHRITDKGNGFYSADNQSEPVGFDVKKGTSYIKTVDGTVYFNNWKLYGETGGTEQLLASANWTNYTAGDDGIYITNIFPGIDAQMKVYRGAIKTNFVVKQLNYSSINNLLFKDEFKTTLANALTFKGAAAGSKQAVNEVVLMNGTTPLVELKEAVAYPAGGDKSKTIFPEYILDGSTLAINVPVSYIAQNISSGNIIIDPLVTSSNTLAQASITGSRYNASCNFTNFCTYNLSVNTPPMATFTDVLWSFTYVTGGICFLEDGAVRFTTGACLSPNAAGFYWFCNAANPGTCTGTNVSVFSDLATCLPAPSCVAQAVPFKMQFFRACWGNTAATCTNGACIGAGSPWVMTIQGQTVDFTNTATPFTLSANTVCFGQSISASTATQYGVAPHTVNWSYSATGSPSAGTGNNVTLSFPSAGTYTVYCTVTDGCAQTATATQVVTVNPLPTLTVTASPNPICLGQSSTLTASGASTYTWSASAGGGTGATAVVNPGVGTTNYSVNATSAFGCVNGGTVSVTVNPLPVVTAVASPTTICSGQSSTLTASGATTYTWSANAGSVTTDTVSVTPGTKDTFTVTGTDGNSCSNTATVSVAVTPGPTLTATANTATICAGQLDTLNVSGATTYTWMPGGANTTTVSVNPASTTSYVVTGDNAGCTSTATVVVNVTPLPSLTVTATPANICTGQSSTLTANGATTYTWSANAGSVNTNTTSVSPGGTSTFTVSATQNGCSDSTTIIVSVAPQATVGIAATQTVFCSGDSTTLTASGATSFTWMPGGSTATTITVTPGVPTTYSLTGSNGGCLDSTSIIITVNPTPSLTVTATPGSICSGQSSTLTATGATTYTWSANAGSVTTDTVSVTPGSTDTFTVVSTALGCSDSTTIIVAVVAQPTLSITPSATTICSGATATLTANGAASYTWSPGASNAGSISVNPTGATTYSLNGANGACLDSTTITINVNPTPTVTAVANPANICSGQSSTLTATGATTFTWMPGSVVSNTISVSPGSTQVYVVTGDSLGCTSTQSVTVNVTATPTVMIITPTPTDGS